MDRIKNLINKYKNRAKYGFFDDETWNLDYSIAKYTLPRLKRFKELNNGYPANLNSKEEWDQILDKIIRSMEITLNDDMEISSVEYMSKLYDEQLEGYELFGKYFMNLWW